MIGPKAKTNDFFYQLQILFAARPFAFQSRDSPHPKRRLRVRLVPRQQSSDVAGLFLRLRHGLGRFVGVICRQNELRSGSGWVRWRLSGRSPPGLITNSFLFCGLFYSQNCVFNKRTSKVCVSCCRRCPGTSAPSAAHPTVSLYLCSSGSNARGESRAREGRRVSSKSPSRVRYGDEGVAGRNRRE